MRVNEAKSAVGRPWERTFLSYSMTFHMKPRLKVALSSVKRLKDALRAEFRKGRGRALRTVITTLTPKLRGWVNYFKLAEVKNVFEELDEWLRHKLRNIIWRQWTRLHTCEKSDAAGIDEGSVPEIRHEWARPVVELSTIPHESGHSQEIL